MNGWLEPTRMHLDAAEQPVNVFFRDDDVGWSDSRLWALLDRFERHATPVDLAVIPAELSRPLTSALRRRRERSAGRLRLHQHGWAHLNHEPHGRRSEFGPSRAIDDVRTDLQRGRTTMENAFGTSAAEVFVPPWNRCSDATAAVLLDEGVRAVSRDATAKPFALAGLAEVPVTVDWLAKRRDGGRITTRQRGDLLGTAVGSSTVGVMLHHAVMTDEDLDQVDDLAELLHSHPRAVLCSMADVEP